jgi:hypothetical protein
MHCRRVATSEARNEGCSNPLRSPRTKQERRVFDRKQLYISALILALVEVAAVVVAANR